MAKKREKTRYIDLEIKSSAFTAFFRTFGIAGKKRGGIDFSEITALRQLLSNERARMLHTLRTKKPDSIYQLAKLLGRDFKSVRKDVELLRHFDLVRLEKGEKGKRKLIKPISNLDVLHLKLKL